MFPLHLAALSGFSDCCRKLLSSGEYYPLAENYLWMCVGKQHFHDQCFPCMQDLILTLLMTLEGPVYMLQLLEGENSITVGVNTGPDCNQDQTDVLFYLLKLSCDLQ